MEFPSFIDIFFWKPGSSLRVSGDDAAMFLQGQFSNDLREIPARSGVYGLWLNQKGKVVADSFVARFEERDFLVGSYFSRGTELIQRLQDYIIADDVEVSDLSAAWTGVSLMGKESGAWLLSEKRVGVVFPGRRVRGENWEWLFPESELPGVRALLNGALEVGADEMARRRIEAAIPAVPADIGITDLPAEGGLDAVAISYNKGCYLGQEVMARLKAMGQVRRRLRRVRGSGSAPRVPARLLQERKQIGELRSVASSGDGFVGLAMVSLINFKEGSLVSLEAPELRTIEILPEAK